MKTVGIILSVLLLLGMITFAVVKLNSPWALTIRQTFKTLSKITVIDSGKLRELEANVKYLEFERDSILRAQREALKENNALGKVIGERDARIVRLTRDLGTTNRVLADLQKTHQSMSPTKTVLTHDNLTSGDSHPISVLKANNKVEVDLSRMAEANYKMEKAEILEDQNEILLQINETLEANNSDLKKMNSNLNLALDQERLISQTYMRERDEFKDLYRSVEGKTSKKLLIAYTIIAVEAIVIGLMIAGGGAN